MRREKSYVTCFRNETPAGHQKPGGCTLAPRIGKESGNTSRVNMRGEAGHQPNKIDDWISVLSSRRCLGGTSPLIRLLLLGSELLSGRIPLHNLRGAGHFLPRFTYPREIMHRPSRYKSYLPREFRDHERATILDRSNRSFPQGPRFACATVSLPEGDLVPTSLFHIRRDQMQ